MEDVVEIVVHPRDRHNTVAAQISGQAPGLTSDELGQRILSVVHRTTQGPFPRVKSLGVPETVIVKVPRSSLPR